MHLTFVYDRWKITKIFHWHLYEHFPDCDRERWEIRNKSISINWICCQLFSMNVVFVRWNPFTCVNVSQMFIRRRQTFINQKLAAFKCIQHVHTSYVCHRRTHELKIQFETPVPPRSISCTWALCCIWMNRLYTILPWDNWCFLPLFYFDTSFVQGVLTLIIVINHNSAYTD